MTLAIPAEPQHPRAIGSKWSVRIRLVMAETYRWRLIGALVAAVMASACEFSAQAETPTASKPAQIDRNGVLILIRSTLLALDQANKTGNYTVLRDIGAPGFQSNTAARLGEIFAKLRNDNLDLSGVAVRSSICCHRSKPMA
jgi:hypothetical protein